jgi:hypothetical protein
VGRALRKRKSKPVITGVPELISYQFRCRLCTLARDDVDTLKTIHEMRRAGTTGRELWRQVRDALAAVNRPAIDRRSIDRHFETHVDFRSEAAEIAAAYQPSPPPGPEALKAQLDSDVEKFFKAASELDEDDDHTDYHQMWEQYRRVNRRIRAFDADPTAFHSADGTLNTMKLQMWVKLVSEARSLLEGVNKMRNQDRLVVAILEAHTKHFALRLIDSIKVEIAEQASLLRDGADAAAVAGSLERLVLQRLPSIFRDAAVDSLHYSREEYSLH